MKTIKVSSILFYSIIVRTIFPKILFCFVLLMPIEMSPLPFLLLLSLCWIRPQAFETTVCDCSEPLRMGILQFSDANCRPKEIDKNSVQVKYGVYSEERAAAHFPGYICAKWKNIKHTTVSFFGQVVIVPDKISIDTTPSECNDMINHKKCNGNEMKASDNKYVFDHDPTPLKYWMSTVTAQITNCVLEKVQLYQQSEDTNFQTPIGTASATAGNLSHNHLTLVWDTTYTHHTAPINRLVESGVGTLTRQLEGEKSFRLQDDENQLDFHLTLRPPCLPLQPNCTNRTSAYDVVGQPKLYLLTGEIKENSSSASTTTPPPPNAEIFSIPANIQYIRDQLTDHENELARLIQILQCDSRKAKHERAIAAAQYNGWLAASQLNLPQCTKLQALGRTAVVIQCKELNVTFDTVVTSCGPQPKFQNFTINLDGWELVKFSPCYWTNGFVNFNGKPYAFRNNTWNPIEANIILPEQSLAHSFRYEDVKFSDYEHRSNPAYSDTMLNHMNIMADIAAAMNEHSQDISSVHETLSTSNVLITASNVGTYTSWWGKLKDYFYIGLLCVSGVVLMRICYCLGFFEMIRSLCCPKWRTSTTATSGSFEFNERLRDVISRNRE